MSSLSPCDSAIPMGFSTKQSYVPAYGSSVNESIVSIEFVIPDASIPFLLNTVRVTPFPDAVQLIITGDPSVTGLVLVAVIATEGSEQRMKNTQSVSTVPPPSPSLVREYEILQ